LSEPGWFFIVFAVYSPGATVDIGSQIELDDVAPMAHILPSPVP